MAPAVPMTQDQFFDFCQQNADKRFERTAEANVAAAGANVVSGAIVEVGQRNAGDAHVARERGLH